MPMTRPDPRIEYTEREVGRLREDVLRGEEDWKRQHEALVLDCWVWENIIVKANRLFDDVLALDTDNQKKVLTGQSAYDPEFEKSLLALIGEWRDAARNLLVHADRLERVYGEVDGAVRLRENIAEAQGILTNDEDFFTGDELAEMRDAAVDAHRAGLTESLWYDGAGA